MNKLVKSSLDLSPETVNRIENLLPNLGGMSRAAYIRMAILEQLKHDEPTNNSKGE